MEHVPFEDLSFPIKDGDIHCYVSLPDKLKTCFFVFLYQSFLPTKRVVDILWEILWFHRFYMFLRMSFGNTVDRRNPANQLISSLSHYC